VKRYTQSRAPLLPNKVTIPIVPLKLNATIGVLAVAKLQNATVRKIESPFGLKDIRVRLAIRQVREFLSVVGDSLIVTE
jgi:hypothetical protein